MGAGRNGQPELGLFLRTYSEYGSRHVVADPVYFNASGQMRSPVVGGLLSDAYSEIAGFQVHAYLAAGMGMYGSMCQFQTPWVDEDMAQRMLRVLRRVRRGMERLNERRGTPRDFADYVTRVADVLCAKRYVITPFDRDEHGGRFANGERHRYVDADGVRSWAVQVCERYDPRPVAAGL